ncbi:5'-3' exonuclease [Bacillus sp. 2205SS5-2]|uniref:5'-3' exonuclease n=1 Tax=Bacillus sp. 2205SS5-2 TaxID=3109031 RepID=UPI003004F824
MKQNVLLIDGMALLFRSFFATAMTGQFMMNSKGTPTNAVQGFVKHSLLAIDYVKPTHVAVCWDMGANTFRNELYDGYKANRDAPPVELHPQFDLAKETATAFTLPNIGLAGYEADDCIGTIAKSLSSENKVSILSGDHDLLQLLEENIDVHILQKGFGNYKTFTEQSFIEEKGITPLQFIDVKGLMGDSSDGYPGVKGIGEKTAIKLIQEYTDIEGILANLEKLTPGQRKKIENDLEMLKLSRTLAEIHCEVPVTFSPEESVWSGITEETQIFLDEHELRSIKRFLIQHNIVSSAETL